MRRVLLVVLAVLVSGCALGNIEGVTKLTTTTQFQDKPFGRDEKNRQVIVRTYSDEVIRSFGTDHAIPSRHLCTIDGDGSTAFCQDLSVAVVGSEAGAEAIIAQLAGNAGLFFWWLPNFNTTQSSVQTSTTNVTQVNQGQGPVIPPKPPRHHGGYGNKD